MCVNYLCLSKKLIYPCWHSSLPSHFFCSVNGVVESHRTPIWVTDMASPELQFQYYDTAMVPPAFNFLVTPLWIKCNWSHGSVMFNGLSISSKVSGSRVSLCAVLCVSMVKKLYSTLPHSIQVYNWVPANCYPLSPNITIQILLTDLHRFYWFLISRTSRQFIFGDHLLNSYDLYVL